LPTKSYRFYKSESIVLAAFGYGEAHKSKTLAVEWDKDTTITNAKLYGKIHAAGGTEGTIIFNGTPVVYCNALLGEATVEDYVDVTSYLVNGDNTVYITLGRPVIGTEKVGYFWATLIITYEGEEPEVKPSWEKYLMPALAVASVVIGMIGIIISLRRGS